MTLGAFCLVLLAAVTHASWNLSAKRAAESLGVVFVEQPVFETRHWLALAATQVVHFCIG